MNKTMVRHAIALLPRRDAVIHYTPEFRQIVKKNPCAITDFIEFYKSGAEEKELADGRIRKVKVKGANHKNTWIVDLGEKSFFMKEIKTGDPAHHQYDDLRKFDGIKTENVAPVKCFFALTMGGKSFLLMESYHGLPHLSQKTGGMTERLRKEYSHCGRGVKKKFGISFLCYENTFLDPVNQKLIAFDPHRKEEFPPSLAEQYVAEPCRIAAGKLRFLVDSFFLKQTLRTADESAQ
jgi:hypothetical protein